MIAEVQRDLIKGSLGEAVNTYQSALQGSCAQLDIDGFAVEFEPESLRGKKFKMTFRLKPRTDETDGES